MSTRFVGWVAFAAVVGLGLGWYVLITPGNPLMRLLQRNISDVNARIIIGPSPEDRDFDLLKRNGVETVVSLLNPAIPYERTLLERETAVAARYGIRLLSASCSRRRARMPARTRSARPNATSRRWRWTPRRRTTRPDDSRKR